MEQNAEAWELWQMVNTQWRAGGMGIIGLDYPAVWTMAKMIEIEMTPCLMMKIQKLEYAVLESMNKS